MREKGGKIPHMRGGMYEMYEIKKTIYIFLYLPSKILIYIRLISYTAAVRNCAQLVEIDLNFAQCAQFRTNFERRFQGWNHSGISRYFFPHRPTPEL